MEQKLRVFFALFRERSRTMKNRVYILPCKHSSQPTRARVLCQSFYKYIYNHQLLKSILRKQWYFLLQVKCLTSQELLVWDYLYCKKCPLSQQEVKGKAKFNWGLITHSRGSKQPTFEFGDVIWHKSDSMYGIWISQETQYKNREE